MHETPTAFGAVGVSAFGGVARALAILGFAVTGSACAEPADAPVIETANGAVELGAAARVHDVTIEQLDGAERFLPSAIPTNRGDIVRFTSHTRDSHAITFQMARLTPGQQGFLAETGQESSPPILAEGDAWILSLEGAPAGTYPFVCLIHETGGSVEVTQE